MRKNAHIIVFFFVLFFLFYPLLLTEGYRFDPLSLYTKLPGYRLSQVPELRESFGGASDLYDAFLPLWKYNYESLRQGVFPLWQFNKGLGAAIYQQSYHPEKLISFLVKPSEALTLLIMLKLFLSMMGMFFLLRSMKVREISCMIGGIAYSLSGFIIGWLHGPQSSVSYHIPFLFLFLIEYLRSRQTKHLFYFALCSSLTIYAGFTPVAAYSFYAAGIFLLLFYLFSKQKLFMKIKGLIKVSLFWILGIIAVSFHFIPTFYSAFIGKTLDISHRRIGHVNFLSPKYFMNILFPSYHGWEISPEIRPYVNSVVLLFFILGLFFLVHRLFEFKRELIEREKYFLSFFIMLIPFTMAMFGLAPFYQISNKLPILNSSPLNRLQSLTSFTLVVLGILGLDLFLQSYKRIADYYKKKKIPFLIVSEILFLFALFVTVISFNSDKETGSHAVYLVFIFISLAILAFQLSVLFKRKAVFFLTLLLLLVSTESILLNRHYVPVNKKGFFITDINVPLIDFIKKDTRKYEGVLVFDSNYNINGTLGNYGIREKIVHQFYERDHRALILDTFSDRSFATPTAPDLSSRYTNFTSSFIQLMGVKYLVFPFEFEGDNLPPFYERVYENLDGKVYQNNLYMRYRGIFFCKPKYFKAENRELVLKDIKTMDYSSYVYLEDQKKLDLNYTDDMSCTVFNIKYSPNKVIYRYQSNSDGILTFPDAYHQDWSVTINGKKTDVLKTNFVFRGVGIKEGNGEIVFTYHRSKFFIVLIILGLISFICLVSLYFYSNKNKRKKNESEHKSL
ncbi:YfhO family protein [Acidobacteriota bacterium]